MQHLLSSYEVWKDHDIDKQQVYSLLKKIDQVKTFKILNPQP